MYGLRIFGIRGNIILDASMRISRFIWNSAQTSSSGSQVLDGSSGLPNITNIRTKEFSIPVDISAPTNPSNCKSSAGVSRSGTTISWTAYTTNYTAGNCIIMVFAYT